MNVDERITLSGMAQFSSQGPWSLKEKGRKAMSEYRPNDIVTLIEEVQRNIETSRLMLKSAIADKDINEAIRYLSIAIDGCIRARDEMEGLRAMGKERLALPWMRREEVR